MGLPSFETAFLDSNQFQGSWIGSQTPSTGSELLLRKGFALDSGAITQAEYDQLKSQALA